MLNLKPVKFGPAEKLLFWSDLHHRHDRKFVFGPRGFSSASEAEESLNRRLRERCDADTTLFLLGDTVFGMGAYEYWMSFLGKFVAKSVYIMAGNHFAGLAEVIDKHGEEFEWANKRVSIIPNYFEILVGGQLIIMSHYALASWNGAGKGAWMVYGHSHGKLMNSAVGHYLHTGKIRDVGVEVSPEPLSFEELKKAMDAKPVVSFDHHREDANAGH